MASNANREVTLTLSTTAEGQEQIRSLADEFRKLAKEGGATAPQFSKLAEELDSLASQAKLANELGEMRQALAEIKTASDAATQALERNKQEVTQRKAALEAANASGADAISQMAKYRVELDQADARLAAARAEMSRYRAEVKAAGTATQEQAEGIKAAGIAIAKYKSETATIAANIKALKPAYTEATTAIRESTRALDASETALRKSQAEFATTAQGVKKLTEQIDAQQGKLSRAGRDAVDYAAALDGLAASLNTAAAQGKELRESLSNQQQAVAAARALEEAFGAVGVRSIASIKAEIRGVDQALSALAANTDVSAAELNRAFQAGTARIAELRKQLGGTEQALQKAFGIVGVRSASTIKDEIRGIEQALTRLASDAAVSGQELSRAFVAGKERVASLRSELGSTARTLETAFGIVGVRSAETINAEILKIDQALQRMAASTNVSGRDFDRAFAAGKGRIAELRRELDGAAQATNRTGGFAQGAIGPLRQMGVALAAAFGLQKFIDANTAIDSAERALRVLTGTAQASAKEMAYVKDVASRLGVDVKVLADNYVGLTAAGRDSALSQSQIRGVFEAVSGAMAVLGKSSFDTENALRAVQQMITKGCHAPGTLIRMADGSAKAVEDVAIGDELMGPDGAPRKVLLLAHGCEPMYRIIPTIGDAFVVNIHHKLRAVWDGEADTLEVIDYLAMPVAVQTRLSLRHATWGDVPFTVEYEDEGDFFGFMISGDHLYLDAQGFEHHNTVSMEELRQQLGEKLPGALQGVATELGLTTAELNDMVAAGKLTYAEVIPALTASMERLYNTGQRVETFQSGLSRATNTMTQAFADLGQSGVMQAIIGVFNVFANSIAAISAGFVFFGKVIGETVGFLLDFKTVLTAPLQALQNYTTGISSAVDEVNKKAAALGDTSQAVVDGIVVLGTETDATGRKILKLADGTKIAADEAAGASRGFVGWVVSMRKAQAAAENAVEVAAKLVEGKKKEGEGIIAAANALGTEIDQRKAAAQVAQANLDAVSKEVAAREQVLDTMREEALGRAEAIRDGKAQTDAHKKNLVDLGENIAKAQAALDASRAQAEQYRLTSEALRVQALALQDNSGRVDQLRGAYEDAAATLADVLALERDGIDVAEQKKRATENVATAAKLYTDGVKDQADKLNDLARLSGNEIQIRDASVRGLQLQLDALRALGQGHTDEAAALERQLALAQLERQAHEDNSLRVAEYAAAVQSAQAEVDRLTRLEQAGVDVATQKAAAELALASASGRYKDSLRDQQSALQANNAVRQASLNLEIASVRAGADSARTAAAIARAKGDEATARRYTLEAADKELRIAYLLADAKSAEANATLAAVAAKREELRASGELSAVKEAELKASELAARAKLIEADAAREAARAARDLAHASDTAAEGARNAGDAAAEAAGGFEQMGEAAGRAAGQVERLGRANKDGSGFVQRQVSTSTIDHRQLAINTGITDEKGIAAFSDSYGRFLNQNVQELIAKGGGFTPGEYVRQYAGAMALAREQAANEARKATGAITTSSAAAVVANTPAQKQEASTSYSIHRVDIGLPSGTTASVAMASEADSNALVGVLKQLGTDMQRAA